MTTPVVDNLAASDTPVETAAPAEATISFTKSQLDELMMKAVLAGIAQAQSGVAVSPVGQVTVPVEVPEVWSANKLMRAFAARCLWYSEREERSAYATIDELYPAETED